MGMTGVRSASVRGLAFGSLAIACLVAGTADPVSADDATALYERDGKFFAAGDVPTFNIAADGSVDWYSYSGYRRYHTDCHVCHGPDGEGSPYAPGLTTAAVNLDYFDFVDIVVNGRRAAEDGPVMPAYGTSPTVMCHLDDIYIYLKARGTGSLDRGRPGAHAPKPAEATAFLKECLGS